MLQEKCVKDITQTLQKTLARSYLQEFAARLNVPLNDERGGAQQAQGMTQIKLTSASHQDEEVSFAQTPASKHETGGSPSRFEKRANEIKKSQAPSTGLASAQDWSKTPGKSPIKRTVSKPRDEEIGLNQVRIQMEAQEDLDEAALQQMRKQKLKEKFENADAQGRAKLLKELQLKTEQDKMIELRQKSGQLRFGDVICITFVEDIFIQDLKQKYDDEAASAIIDPHHPNIMMQIRKNLRTSDEPDYTYRGMVFCDGVLDSNMKVLPQITEGFQNARNLFKQCLFMIEIEQECHINQKAIKLDQQKSDIEARRSKMIAESGGESNMNQEQLKFLNDELNSVIEDIERNKKDKQQQDENNSYEQKFRAGNKLTYGSPFQLRHLFSNRYLSVNTNDMSQEYGCCEVHLSETKAESVFIMESTCSNLKQEGKVVNYADFFNIRSLKTDSPFYLHVFKKISDQNYGKEDKIFPLNASQDPSNFRAKLFMGYDEQEKARSYIQSGDVIRLKHLEINSYLSCSPIDVDEILPAKPDFLSGQILRMNNGTRIEYPKGGKDKSNLTEAEKQDLEINGSLYDQLDREVNEEYVKLLKGRQLQQVYLETQEERLYFTNSCWEIQRANSLQGGNLVLDDAVRLKHIGSGKYLAISDNGTDLMLQESSQNLTCLFVLRQDISGKSTVTIPDKENQIDADGLKENSQLLKGGQGILIQSWLYEGYLQLANETKSAEVKTFENKMSHIGSAYADQETSRLSQVRLICHKFQKIERFKMLFQVEEVEFEKANQAYQGCYVFDELLEYYAFLNSWAVSKNEHEDQVEKLFYEHEQAVDKVDDLVERTAKITLILQNIEENLKILQDNPFAYSKSKTQLLEQGILDIMCQILTIIYFKSTPPPMFQKPFKSIKQSAVVGENEDNKDLSWKFDLEKLRIDEYLAQEIARDRTEHLVMKIFEILIVLAKSHRRVSERLTKYFNILYQHWYVQEQYFQLQQINKEFKTTNPKAFKRLIGELFKKAQKNAMFVYGDRMSNAMVEQAPQKKHNYLAIDSDAANKIIEMSQDSNQVQKWLDLLEPVKFKSPDDQNLETQITILNILSMYCRDKEGKGVYPYQMQVIQHLFDKDENILLKFGEGKVGNNLRPFVYFVRPKSTMNLQMFLKNNPILQNIQDNFNMQQRNQNQYELVFDLHEMTKKHDTKGNETWPYINYICAVLNLYAHICLSSNTTGIKCMADIGLKEGHILLCIHKDNERLLIHEKFKQIYMFLARTIYVQNDPVAPGILQKNRCYIWEKLSIKQRINKDPLIANDNGGEEKANMNGVENDFYAGMAKKKTFQMEDPNNSMIVLRFEQDSKDLSLIRIIKEVIVWFLTEGPSDTAIFFYEYKSDNKFMPKQLKIKLKSLKIYLDIIYALICEDCADPKFIENIKLICQCALTGCSHYDEVKEVAIPEYITSNWVYQLCWLAQQLYKSNPKDNRNMANAVHTIEGKVLDIFEKLSGYRLNLQIQKYLELFRDFQEKNLQAMHASPFKDLEDKFNELFKLHSINVDITKTDLYLKLREEQKKSPQELAIEEKQIQFDLIFTQYIFINNVNEVVRKKALQVLISNFTQREMLIKELSKTEIIVTGIDYKIYLNFLSKQRQMKQLTQKLIQDEMYHLIYKKSPGAENKSTKTDVINILKSMGEEIQKSDVIEKKKLQNMLRHIGFITDIKNQLLKRLIFKENQYRELFQQCIDFFFQCSFDNQSTQKLLLPDLNYFIDLLNKQVQTGLLISELLKCNTDPEFSQQFAKYLINKIVNEGYFNSTLIRQLIKLAENNSNPEKLDDNVYLKEADESSNRENPNQQFILKQLIKSPRFRQYLMMRKSMGSKKIGIIKTYSKKREQYTISQKEPDEALLIEKEQLDLHISIVDLITACARNSPFCIAQAQKLIEVNELLDSLLTDCIPYIVKRHYFMLLYEVYLRKIPSLDQGHRLPLNDIKLNQVMKWVVLYDLEASYVHYAGLVQEANGEDPPDKQRKLKQILREVNRASEAEFDDKNALKTQKDKEDERKFKASLSQYKDTQAFFVLDRKDLSEFWRYLYDKDPHESRPIGLLYFLEQFYRDYSVRELNDENLVDSTCKIRDRLLAMVNKVFQFVDQHEEYMRPYIQEIIRSSNQAIYRMPHIRAFRVGKKRIFKEGRVQEMNEEEDEQSLDLDESREVDNRMSGDKVLRIIRDYIIKENVHIREALQINNITSDYLIKRDVLKESIKKICGTQSSYEEILKAIDYFHSVSLEKKQERQVMNVEPGQPGYIMNRNEGMINLRQELQGNMINFKDVEIQLKDVLKKAGYKAPNQQRERGGDEKEKLVQNIKQEDLSIGINMDLKLFTQRFNEFINMTESFSEIHDYVHKLCINSEFTKSKSSKVQLIKNLMTGFTGLTGDLDEIVLTSILNLVIKRYIPDDMNMNSDTLKEIRKREKQIKSVLLELREWQDVMFEAGVPKFLLGMINLESTDTYLSNKCLTVLNNILSHSSERNQQQMLDILKEENRFFSVFYYLNTRLKESTKWIISKIKQGAQQKFINSRITENDQISNVRPNDFKRQKIYLDIKYDVEKVFNDQKEAWRDDEINNILIFLNQMCENCFRPAQLFLKEQITDGEGQKSRNSGKLTSIDLVYQVVNVFIMLVNELGDYVFSDFRTYKLLPILLDTLIEFMYGPCIENQIFLSRWKKLLQVLNSLIDQKDYGNYTGLHHESKAQLAILTSSVSVLKTMADIKNKEEARITHNMMIKELNIDNLVKRFTEIFVFKIGGTKDMMKKYLFDMECSHFNNQVDSLNKCIENEFCQYGHLIPRDKQTIQTGFNIYMMLRDFQNTCRDHEKMKVFQRDEEEFRFLQFSQGLFKENIFKKVKFNAERMSKNQNKFNTAEKDLLDELIIHQFPETFIAYVNKEAALEVEGNRSKELLNLVQKAKQSKTLLEKTQRLDIIRRYLAGEIQDINNVFEREGHSQEETGNISEYSADELINKSAKRFHQHEHDSRSWLQKVFFCCKQNKAVAPIGEQEDINEEEERANMDNSRKDFMLQLFQYQFYIASNFYEDNIATVEVVRKPKPDETRGQIFTTQFKMPTKIHLLTTTTQDMIPYQLTGVSQQEKVENFTINSKLLEIEMDWQQYLGQKSYWLRLFGNLWDFVAWINLLVIWLINILIIIYYIDKDKASKICPNSSNQDDQSSTQDTSSTLRRFLQEALDGNTANDTGEDGGNFDDDSFGLYYGFGVCPSDTGLMDAINRLGQVQTILAALVCISFYINYRANLKYVVMKSNQERKERVQGYGWNKGSIGYGNRKSDRIWVKFIPIINLNGLMRLVSKSITGKLMILLFKEIHLVLTATKYDTIHFRNVVYFFLSIMSNTYDIIYAFLLLDIMFKIKSLYQVLAIFKENKLALGSTLLLFFVLFYIFAFSYFIKAREDYSGEAFGGEKQEGCDSLSKCLAWTISLGIRAGGGIGDSLKKPEWKSEDSGKFIFRYIMDLGFFLIINIIMLNIFFGIIIDAFGAKRDNESQITIEVEDQCFICGIKKSVFEIENLQFSEHIYCDHNIHSWVAFLVYVRNKDMSECSGIEKWVKSCLQEKTIDFFPINRCLKIKNGSVVEY